MPPRILIAADYHGIVHPCPYAPSALDPKVRLADEVPDLPPNGEHQHGDEGREECGDPHGVPAERTQ